MTKRKKSTMPPPTESPFICDAHIDTLSKMLKFGRSSFSDIPASEQVTASRLRRSAIGVAVFALFSEKYERTLPPPSRTLRMLDMAYSLAAENSDWIELARNTREIGHARRKGKIALVLSIENGIAIGDDLGLLRNFHRLGVRLMGLTWNYRNLLGDGVGKYNGRRGLTSFGRETLDEMAKLGIIADVSHLNEKTFWQVVEAVEGPIVATHSNAFAMCNNVRNLTDPQIKAISEKGGFIGVNFCTWFLNESGDASIDDVVRHACHIADVGGSKVLAIGSDYDGIFDTPAGLEHIGKAGRLIPPLRKAGFSNAEIDAISHRNFLRVFRNVCG